MNEKEPNNAGKTSEKQADLPISESDTDKKISIFNSDTDGDNMHGGRHFVNFLDIESSCICNLGFCTNFYNKSFSEVNKLDIAGLSTFLMYNIRQNMTIFARFFKVMILMK